MKPSVLDRSEYDEYRNERLSFNWMLNPKEIARQLERKYPKTSSQAVSELAFRGFDIKVARLEYYISSNNVKLRTIRQVRLWYKSDIDDLARHLESKRKFTKAAKYRSSIGMSWQEEHAMCQQKESEYIDEIAESLGISRIEVYAAFTAGMGSEMYDDSSIECVDLVESYRINDMLAPHYTKGWSDDFKNGAIYWLGNKSEQHESEYQTLLKYLNGAIQVGRTV